MHPQVQGLIFQRFSIEFLGSGFNLITDFLVSSIQGEISRRFYDSPEVTGASQASQTPRWDSTREEPDSQAGRQAASHSAG